MSLKEIQNDGTVTKHCVACTQDDVVAPASVELGRSLPGNKMAESDPDVPPIIDPDIIIMPPCSGCGGITTYQQNHDKIDAQYVGSTFDRQRRAVNAYAKKLKELGRKNADCVVAIDAQSTPTDIMTIEEAVNLPVAVKRVNRGK